MTSTSTVQYRPIPDSLPARLQNGDRDAFANRYRSTADRPAYHLAARLRDADAVEDSVQEAFRLALADPQLLDADPLRAASLA
jgi:DNA-directed RNA polymerase specialized sigma24 family protein